MAESIDLYKSNLFEYDRSKAYEAINKNKSILSNYMNIIEILFKEKKYRETSEYIYQASNYITTNHAGLFTSPRLEEIMKECAQHTPKMQPLFKFKNTNKRKVLHVMSEAYEIGGHTRLVKHWIKSDKDSTHSLINTWDAKRFPDWLRKEVTNSGGEVYTLDDTSGGFMKRAAILRDIAYEWADIVVLHVHMMDPAPIIAFGIDGGPPIVYVNHFDHGFWLGTSIADVVVDISQSGRQLSLKRRGIKNSIMMPIPVDYIPNNLDRNEIRKKNNIKEDVKVLLTIASEHKFTSVNNIHYCDIAKEIITNTDNTMIIVIGPSNNGRWAQLCEETNDRVKVLGEVPDVREFYILADMYLEPYVMGSYTSRLDAILNELPAIKFANKLYPKITDMFDELELLSFDNIGQMIECINKYEKKYDNEVFIKSNKMREFVKRENVDLTAHYINNIYNNVDEHKVRNIDTSDVIEDIDLIWALLNEWRN